MKLPESGLLLETWDFEFKNAKIVGLEFVDYHSLELHFGEFKDLKYKYLMEQKAHLLVCIRIYNKIS